MLIIQRRVAYLTFDPRVRMLLPAESQSDLPADDADKNPGRL
jgi:hypothetical protein